MSWILLAVLAALCLFAPAAAQTITIPGNVVVQIDAAMIPPGPQGPAGPAGGKILQVVPMAPMTTFPSTANTGYSVAYQQSITPTDPNSKILISTKWSLGVSALNITTFALFRGATDLTPAGLNGFKQMRSPDADSIYSDGFDWVDSPGTAGSPVTYSVQWKVNAQTSYLGRRGTATDLKGIGATMVLIEVAP